MSLSYPIALVHCILRTVRARRAIERESLFLLCVALLFLSFFVPRAHAFSPVDDEVVDSGFEQNIAPILIVRCIECHRGQDPSGGLDLSRREGLQHGGESGEVIEGGGGLLLEHVEDGTMPPKKNGKVQKLSVAEIASLRRWIESGAYWPDRRVLDLYERTNENRAGRDWWSFQPVVSPAADREANPGDVKEQNPIALEIDRQIEKGLIREGLTMAPPARPRELIRRLYYDLVGLPPERAEVLQFEEEPSGDAYRQMVDRLIASDQFAERWTQHWLDVVRFAETNGYERDAVKKDAWRYRDWVLNSIREDKPYDRFIIEQIAGDLLPDKNESTVIATGFLRLGAWDDEPNDPNEYQYERLEDMVHVTSTAFLGLTAKCARCHDHKFDPIPQVDYYQIASHFWKGPIETRKREWNGGPTVEELGFDVLGWTDIPGKETPLHLLIKGNPQREGEVVNPGVLTALVRSDDSRTFLTRRDRLGLAQWIASADNALTPRVAVNRFWVRMFGDGIVKTPDNFGFTGGKPTHPELLDYLASEFIKRGWSLKEIVRGIALSRVYQQSSLNPSAESYQHRDAGNQFYWHANRRRLDAESIRDAILKVCGNLESRMGGPSFNAPIDNEALEGLSMKGNAYQASPDSETKRRSLYIFKKRALAVPMMTVFDSCDNTLPSGKRDTTIVAPQALAMMNGTFVHQQSSDLANAIAGNIPADGVPSRERSIRLAWQKVLLREPTDLEVNSTLEWWRKLVERERVDAQSDESQIDSIVLVRLCHTLLNTNEFVFID